MMVDTVIRAEGDVLNASRSFLGKLLREQIVDYLLVPQEIAHGRTVTQTLVKSPDHLVKANPFSPVMSMNSATIVSQLTSDNLDKKLGVVIKPCEIRAFVELVKLGKAKRENLLIIGTDCLGTYEVEDYARYIDRKEGPDEVNGAQALAEMLRNIETSDTELPIPLRSACRMCNAITPSLADITLSIFGTKDGILVCLEAELATKLGLEVKETPGRQEAIAGVVNRRTAVREKVFTEFREKMGTITAFADALATCSRCYACQSACPICYCRICFFRTKTFEPESERYFRWAEHEDVVRMPSEILLYHLTRLNHMAASCVGCGMCESTCPRDLPLSTIFQAVGDRVQQELHYKAGRSFEQLIPIATFKEAEV